MKITQNGIDITKNFTDRINFYKQEFNSKNCVVLNTMDYTEHFSSYLAWLEVGGNIFVINPLESKKNHEYFYSLVDTFECKDSLIIPTSGTTGRPKLAITGKKHHDLAQKMTIDIMQWNSNVSYINYAPAPNSGFWRMFMPAAVASGCHFILGSVPTIMQDIETGANQIGLVTPLIDMVRSRFGNVDMSKFDVVAAGASQVLKRHTDYLFQNGMKKFVQIYGINEAGAPSLSYTTSKHDENCFGLRVMSEYGIEWKLTSEGELLMKGPMLCENIETFGLTSDGWYATGDIFENVDGELLKYRGRTNEILKINGYKTNLIEIETVAEEKTTLGDCIAVPRKMQGIDFIELMYTGNIENKEFVNTIFEDNLPKYGIPKKLTKIKAVPRNSLSKKIRKDIDDLIVVV